MLENLHVKDLALIEEIDVNFEKGFNVITGETGAGKSIILGSINLALGQRAGADIIRNGKDSALIELSFLLNESEAKRVREMDLPIEEDNVVLLQRKITSQKSILRMNGETITAGKLKELSGVLLDMYGQHEHQSLLKSSTYSRMLDEYSEDRIKENKEKLKSDLKEYKRLLEIKNSDISDEDIRRRQIELLSYEIKEIEDAGLKIGEDDELEEQFKFLSNIRLIMESTANAYALTHGEEGAASYIGEAARTLKGIIEYDSRAYSIYSSLMDIEAELSELNRELSDYGNSLSFDEESYLYTQERLNELNRLKGKYHGSIEDILILYEKKCKELEELNNYGEYIENIDNEIKKLHDELLKLCGEISSMRKKAAVLLEKKLADTMESLNFLNVELSICILKDEEHITENGYDKVDFMISMNPGEAKRPMQEVASGGELSRVMLAFKSVFADKEGVSTLIFDEIDTGISGVTAFKVAQKMNELAKDHQLICISHLGQIAAMADQHYLIEKKVVDDRTRTQIMLLDEEGSVRELARMAGSGEMSEIALNSARELKAKKGI